MNSLVRREKIVIIGWSFLVIRWSMITSYVFQLQSRTQVIYIIYIYNVFIVVICTLTFGFVRSVVLVWCCAGQPVVSIYFVWAASRQRYTSHRIQYIIYALLLFIVIILSSFLPGCQLADHTHIWRLHRNRQSCEQHLIIVAQSYKGVAVLFWNTQTMFILRHTLSVLIYLKYKKSPVRKQTLSVVNRCQSDRCEYSSIVWLAR